MKFIPEKFMSEFECENKLTNRARNNMKILIAFMRDDPSTNNIYEAAYMFATVWHECAGTFAPIEEFGKGKGRAYGMTADNGQIFYGRGYVQITWDYNYKRVGKEMGVDLYNNPNLALHYDIAYKIMSKGMKLGWFTGVGFNKYIKPGIKPNYVTLRKIINGTDRAVEIAKKAEKAQKYFELSAKE